MIARMTTAIVVVITALLGTSAFAQERVALDTGALAERVEKSAWSDASWQADLDAAAGLARHTHPAATARLLRLEGLNPDRYLALRRSEPEVARELTRLVRDDVVPAALVAELLVEGTASYPFSRPQDFAKRPGADVQRLMRMEREQLDAGLLLSLGDSRHASAFFVIRGALLDEARPDALRRVAAISLGKTRDARAVTALSALSLDDKTPIDLRTAAVAGLAHVRSLEAVISLATLSRTTTEPTLQRATALALGNGASAWTLGSLSADDAEQMRTHASSALVDLLERSDEALVASAVIDALGMVAHESATARLRALHEDERRPAALRERASRAERRVLRAIERSSR